ncbi:MAG: hypothetical protein ACLFV3_09250 [Phycisphaeraceae bacterium]
MSTTCSLPTWLPKGTWVRVRLDDGSVMETTTRSQPWKLGGHTWVVQLDGMAARYALDRLVVWSVNGPFA